MSSKLLKGVLAGLATIAVLVPASAQAAPPSNDNFAGRTQITARPYTTSQSNVEATMEPSEPTSACGFDSIRRTLWYEFRPAMDGWLQVDTVGSDFDTIVGVWTGNGLDNLVEVACSDDVLYTTDSTAVFFGRADITYLFQVGGYGTDAGNLALRLGSPTAGSISGTVTSDAGGGLRQVCVDAVDAGTHEYITGAETAGSGTYNLGGLPSGSYLLTFDDCDERIDHFGEWYNNRPTQELADAVAVTSPQATTGIDAQLAAIRLSVSRTGGGSGTITSQPQGIDCGADCDEVFEYGTLVTLTATPRTDSEVAGWTGCDAAVGAQCTVTVYEARAVQARFEIDVTPPDTTITQRPGNPSSSTTASFAFTASEPGSTFECALDAEAFSPCVSPKTYSDLAAGPHTFSVRGTDVAGNTDPSPASYAWTIDLQPKDTTPPETSITAGPSGPSATRNPTFEFISSESGSTFACSLDGAPFETCSSPTSYYTPIEGSQHTFLVRATDPAGNVDPTPAERTWVVDANGPYVSITRPTAGLYVNDQGPVETGPAIVVVGSVTVEARASDEQSGVPVFRFEVDGVQVDPSQVTKQGDSFRFIFRPATPGEHTITARATNGSGTATIVTRTVYGVPLP